MVFFGMTLRAGYAPDFYPYMLRNLSIFRDIAKIIFDARQRQHNTIIFKDEHGDTWQLVKVGEPRQSRYSLPAVRTENKSADTSNFKHGYGAGDKDCLK